MLATPQGGECDEEWDEYYRICKDKDYLGQANVGGAVDSDGAYRWNLEIRLDFACSRGSQ